MSSSKNSIQALVRCHLLRVPNETRTMAQLEAYYTELTLGSPVGALIALSHYEVAAEEAAIAAKIAIGQAMTHGEFDDLVLDVSDQKGLTLTKALMAMDRACERIDLGMDSYSSAGLRLGLHHQDMSDYFERGWRK